MIQKIQSILLKTSIFLIALLAISPVAVFAADPPTTTNIQGAACTGSGIKITSDPNENACKSIENEGGSTANKLVKTVVNILTLIVGILAVIMIIFAGFRYVTSGGKDDAVKGAKNTILYAVIGLVIVALAQIIVRFVITKTSEATNPSCVVSGNTHKWDSGPNAGKTCTP